MCLTARFIGPSEMIKSCVDCSEDVIVQGKEERAVCLDCLDVFMANGGRSNPFWRDQDVMIQRMVDVEAGDL